MKKIVEMIYCHPLNFCSFLKMLLFFMKIEWNKRSADGGMFGNSLCAQNATESVLFFLSYFIGPVLYWRTVWKKVVGMHCKYMISFKMFVLRPMENQLVPSPHMKFQDSAYHCSEDVMIGYKKWWMDGQAESNMILKLFLCAHAILCTWLRPSLHKSKLQSHELNIMR